MVSLFKALKKFHQYTLQCNTIFVGFFLCVNRPCYGRIPVSHSSAS